MEIAGSVCEQHPVVCFVSHKCESDGPRKLCKLMAGSQFGRLLRSVFSAHSVELLIDPFEPGVEVGARIASLPFDALLYLSTPESQNSCWCQAELTIAVDRSIPVFVIRLQGDVPEELRRRIVLDAEYSDREFRGELGNPAGDLRRRLHQFAGTIRARASLRKQIEIVVSADSAPTDQRTAGVVIEDADPTTIAEFVTFLDDSYTLKIDPAARCSLARALGKSNSAEAMQVLTRWLDFEDHPYPKQGIEEALGS